MMTEAAQIGFERPRTCRRGALTVMGRRAYPTVRWRAAIDEDGHYCFAVAL